MLWIQVWMDLGDTEGFIFPRFGKCHDTLALRQSDASPYEGVKVDRLLPYSDGWFKLYCTNEYYRGTWVDLCPFPFAHFISRTELGFVGVGVLTQRLPLHAVKNSLNRAVVCVLWLLYAICKGSWVQKIIPLTNFNKLISPWRVHIIFFCLWPIGYTGILIRLLKYVRLARNLPEINEQRYPSMGKLKDAAQRHTFGARRKATVLFLRWFVSDMNVIMCLIDGIKKKPSGNKVKLCHDNVHASPFKKGYSNCHVRGGNTHQLMHENGLVWVFEKP